MIDTEATSKGFKLHITTFTVLTVLGTLLTVHTVYQITGKQMIIHGAVTLHTFLSDRPRLS